MNKKWNKWKWQWKLWNCIANERKMWRNNKRRIENGNIEEIEVKWKYEEMWNDKWQSMKEKKWQWIRVRNISKKYRRRREENIKGWKWNENNLKWENEINEMSEEMK